MYSLSIVFKMYFTNAGHVHAFSMRIDTSGPHFSLFTCAVYRSIMRSRISLQCHCIGFYRWESKYHEKEAVSRVLPPPRGVAKSTAEALQSSHPQYKTRRRIDSRHILTQNLEHMYSAAAAAAATEDENECSICQSAEENPGPFCRTDCGHLFHRKCLRKLLRFFWKETRAQQTIDTYERKVTLLTCPLCRHILSPETQRWLQQQERIITLHEIVEEVGFSRYYYDVTIENADTKQRLSHQTYRGCDLPVMHHASTHSDRMKKLIYQDFQIMTEAPLSRYCIRFRRIKPDYTVLLNYQVISKNLASLELDSMEEIEFENLIHREKAACNLRIISLTTQMHEYESALESEKKNTQLYPVLRNLSSEEANLPPLSSSQHFERDSAAAAAVTDGYSPASPSYSPISNSNSLIIDSEENIVDASATATSGYSPASPAYSPLSNANSSIYSEDNTINDPATATSGYSPASPAYSHLSQSNSSIYSEDVGSYSPLSPYTEPPGVDETAVETRDLGVPRTSLLNSQSPIHSGPSTVAPRSRVCPVITLEDDALPHPPSSRPVSPVAGSSRIPDSSYYWTRREPKSPRDSQTKRRRKRKMTEEEKVAFLRENLQMKQNKTKMRVQSSIGATRRQLDALQKNIKKLHNIQQQLLPANTAPKLNSVSRLRLSLTHRQIANRMEQLYLDLNLLNQLF